MSESKINFDEDRNFDDLHERFSKNIYQSLKGQIRLAVLRHDLQEVLPALWESDSLSVLDAGGGLGMFTTEFARLGHRVNYCDISKKMLDSAAELARAEQLATIQFHHESVQSHIERDCQYNVILLHAVLEWLADPRQVLEQVLSAMQAGSHLSLLFYNQQSIVFRNLIRGNFFKASASDQQGDKGSLTPSNPLKPDDVKSWISSHNDQNDDGQPAYEICCESGVRVFYDYSERERIALRTSDQVIETEIAFSRQEPYRALGRYYHLIIKKLY
ncbi:MAG: methyltransferase domain-containing protein [Pseudomonadales bacterium]|nr:methyltransferase domain-containing protein [Pseudomonadales bacterium]